MQAQLLQSMMVAGLGWLAAFPLIQQACPVCRAAAGSGRFPCLAGVSAPAQPSVADKAEQGRKALTPRGRDSVWQALQALHSVYEVRLKPAPCCSHCLLACCKTGHMLTGSPCLSQRSLKVSSAALGMSIVPCNG